MRPLYIEVEGFMAFKEKQTLDFKDWNLFVLSGPTGSGKSSIIDAMICALFGQTPRIGNQIKQLVSKDAKHCRITFDFELKGQKHRFVRIFNTKSKHDVQAYQWENDDWDQKEAGSKAIKVYTENLLGMDFDAFTRVIVLPQGGFARFLKPEKAADRRDMLIKLARLGIYNKIKEEASNIRKELELDLKKLEAKLEEADVSPEDLKQQQILRQEMQEELKVKKETCLQSENAYKAIQQILDLQNELTQLEQSQAHLQERREQIQVLEKQLETCQKLLVLAADMKYRDGYQQENLDNQRKIEQLKQELEDTQKHFKEAEQSYFKAQESSQEVSSLQQKMEALKLLEPQVQELSEYQQQLGSTNSIIKDKESLLKTTQHQQLTEESTLENLTKKEAEIQGKLTHLDLNPDRLKQLRELKPDLIEGERLNQEIERVKTQLSSQEDALQQKQAELTEAKNKEQSKQTSLDEHQNHLKQLEEQLIQEKNKNLALEVRKHVNSGEPCPVCLQTISQVPQAESESNTQAMEEKVQAAQQEIQVLNQGVQNYARKVATFESELKSMKDRSQEYQTQLQNLKNEQEALKDKLEIASLANQSLQELESEIKVLENKQDQSQQLKESLNRTQQEKISSGSKIEQLKERIQLNQESLEEHQQKAQQLTDKVQQITRKLEEKLGQQSDYSGLLQSEIESCQTRIQQLQQTLESSRETRQQLENQLKEKQVLLNSKAEALEKVKKKLKEVTEMLLEKVKALSYFDIESARADLKSEAQLENWSQEIKSFYQEIETLQAKKQSLEKDLSGRSTSEEEVSEHKESFGNLKAELDELNRQDAKLELLIKNIEATLERNKELNQQRSDLQVEMGVYKQIEDDLKSNNVPDFVFNRIMEQLLEAANQELYRMTNRYRFKLDNEDMYVVDEWNAGELRQIKTMSGGETFMASLALALSLNEYLSQNNHLGSLFIDEGFGTLDPESLDQAAAAIESLTHQGKMIGVITHVGELADRLPVKIEVKKRESGSNIKVPVMI